MSSRNSRPVPEVSVEGPISAQALRKFASKVHQGLIRKLVVTSATLVVTGALLVVTRS